MVVVAPFFASYLVVSVPFEHVANASQIEMLRRICCSHSSRCLESEAFNS